MDLFADALGKINDALGKLAEGVGKRKQQHVTQKFLSFTSLTCTFKV